MNDKADRLRRLKPKLPDVPAELRHRVPPGQTVTERFPILHEGTVPAYELNNWSLRLFGEVEKERSFSFQELLELPQVKIVCDIHCVTRWSKLDTEWEGVRLVDLLPLIGVKPEAKHVMIHADPNYETNVPLEDLMRDNVILAHRYNGEPLTDKHGWPLRLIVPHLYFWKSAKWVRGIELMLENRNGYWERNGFHHYADPFKEQRFSDDDYEMPIDEWLYVDYD
ncbi:sulfite oxidase-like oxidoreductase [Paenibacillus nanensis]|uniref:Sulfite oxidase-like oxidoreductase n=1 Tax=Paenibacillus nanensis TaxID=393251 RepID=A0A3A1UQS0_9BACL|nr:sulfite oxidase-like oxidoreductase [Paenibacillus nanensis]RIX50604.1 sulfite oxidase-like oxidoreductase [Paenibacillus nanensis]